MVIDNGEGWGATKREVGGGGQVKFYPYRKERSGGLLAMLNEGAQNVLW